MTKDKITDPIDDLARAVAEYERAKADHAVKAGALAIQQKCVRVAEADEAAAALLVASRKKALQILVSKVAGII